MNKIRTNLATGIFLSLMVFQGLITVSQAQWTNYFSVMDIDFDGEAYGVNPQTTTPNGSPPGPFPVTNLYALTAPNNDFANSNGTTHTVGDAAGLTKALIFSNNITSIGNPFADTQFIPARGERGIMEFDLAIMATPSSPNQQVVPGTPNGQDFVINTFADSGARLWRFFTSHTSPTGGDIFMRLPGAGAGTNIGTYTVGVPFHVAIDSYYAIDRVSVYLNGSPVVSGLPFVDTRSGTNDQATEFFIFQNGVSGQLNVTALDNIVYTIVPEPSSILLAAMGIAGVISVLRRR